jgi:cyclopropane fatty-acyl-phospholipid synthase-like methyltransferase/methyltransferase-like protein
MTTHTYEEFPYLCVVRPDIQPGQLATLAALFNVSTPPVVTSRILELGCGNGINLIATAQSWPHSNCLGIDSSARQIADGPAIIAAVGLPNITLQQLDILEFDKSFGTFDYIVIHGVYSWVSEEVREQLLNICQHPLAPQGVAYVSYNTYPGWYPNQLIRELMLYFHTQQFQEVRSIHPVETKQLLQLAVLLNQGKKDAFTLALQEQWERFQKTDVDNYLRHDLLELASQPVYFYQFIEHARQHDLEYVTDIKFRDSLLGKESLLRSPIITEQLFKGDFFAQEQYLDFFYNRKLRMSLLCHQGRAVKRELDPQWLPSFYLAAVPLQEMTPAANLEPLQPLQWRKMNGQIITIDQPLIKVTLAYLLHNYPRYITFAELFQQVATQLPAVSSDTNSQEELRLTLAMKLLESYGEEVIDLSVYPPPPFTMNIGDYPTVSPLARGQASQNQTTVVNLLCQWGQLDDFTCQLLPQMDGNNSRQALLEMMIALVHKNNSTLLVGEEEVPVSQLSTPEVRHLLELYLEEILGIIAKNALLIPT